MDGDGLDLEYIRKSMNVIFFPSSATAILYKMIYKDDSPPDDSATEDQEV